MDPFELLEDFSIDREYNGMFSTSMDPNDVAKYYRQTIVILRFKNELQVAGKNLSLDELDEAIKTKMAEFRIEAEVNDPDKTKAPTKGKYRRAIDAIETLIEFKEFINERKASV